MGSSEQGRGNMDPPGQKGDESKEGPVRWALHWLNPEASRATSRPGQGFYQFCEMDE